MRREPVARHVVLLFVACLTACTASWNRLVRYSSEPMPRGLDLQAGVYRAIAQAYEDTVITYLLPGFPVPFASGTMEVVGGPGAIIPGHWADTLKVEVLAALTDSGFGTRPDTVALRQALSMLPAHSFAFLPPGASADSLPRVGVSSPGFNHDSTIAAIRVAYMVGNFISGHTVLLARRPGTEWSAWYSILMWIT